MPYQIKKVGKHYQVSNRITGKIFSKHTTKRNAIRQVALLTMLHKAI
jgi:hypothetical protein